uniref:Uncharacterized protein n=1 Tax=Rhizophora mucronata TaxID=61149 RepID=A0A2P2M4S1_RHIMU
MASTSGAGPSGQDEDLEEDEELERFDDFTLASSWERFISEIEAICRQWQSDGPKNLLVGLLECEKLFSCLVDDLD